MSKFEYNIGYMVTMAVYTVIWWWLTGLFGLIAAYGYSKFLDQHLERGEKIDGRLLWVVFLESKKYWISAFLISFAIGFFYGLLFY